MKSKYVCPLSDLWVIDYNDMVVQMFWQDTIPFQDHLNFVLFHIEILACYPSFLRSDVCGDETDGEPTGRVWPTEYRDSPCSRVRALGSPLGETIVQLGEGRGQCKTSLQQLRPFTRSTLLLESILDERDCFWPYRHCCNGSIFCILKPWLLKLGTLHPLQAAALWCNFRILTFTLTVYVWL